MIYLLFFLFFQLLTFIHIIKLKYYFRFAFFLFLLIFYVEYAHIYIKCIKNIVAYYMYINIIIIINKKK